jgi:hypothetical protein
MNDSTSHDYDTCELVAQWHDIVETYVAEELVESTRRLTELSSTQHEAGSEPVALARHLAHALLEATAAHGVAAAVHYLQDVAGVRSGDAVSPVGSLLPS